MLPLPAQPPLAEPLPDAVRLAHAVRRAARTEGGGRDARARRHFAWPPRRSSV